MGNPVENMSASHRAGRSVSIMVEDEAVVKKDNMEVDFCDAKGEFPRYLAQSVDCEFSVSDMVWGKVKGHSWWPAQIFDPSDASEAALKCKKRDGYLVAYFGDHTFAWNDVSLLRPYNNHFTQMAKQSSMTAFVDAVNCSLDEVSRRVEFGFACYCTSGDVYDKIPNQDIDNAGIREGASIADNAYGAFSLTFFEPEKLVGYLKNLASCPTFGCDELDLTVAKAQLLSFYRTKGYLKLPNFSVHLAWPDKEAELSRPGSTEKVNGQDASPRKRKSSFSEDGVGRSKKQKMDCKSADFISVGSGKIKKRKFGSFYDSDKADNSPGNKKSLKVGKYINQITTKLARTPLSGKNSAGKIKKYAKVDENNHEGVASDISSRAHEVHQRKAGKAVNCSSVDEMLSQLCRAARDPLRLYSFIPTVACFFSEFRNEFCTDNCSLTKGVKTLSVCKSRGRKPAKSESGSDETVKTEGVEDSCLPEPSLHGSKEELDTKLESDPSLKKDDDNLSCANESSRQILELPGSLTHLESGTELPIVGCTNPMSDTFENHSKCMTGSSAVDNCNSISPVAKNSGCFSEFPLEDNGKMTSHLLNDIGAQPETTFISETSESVVECKLETPSAEGSSLIGNYLRRAQSKLYRFLDHIKMGRNQ